MSILTTATRGRIGYVFAHSSHLIPRITVLSLDMFYPFERAPRARIICYALAAVWTFAGLSQSGCRKRVQTPAAAPAPVTPRLSFNEHIQPILSENCYACHGSDARARKGELRLDRPTDAFAPRKG